MDRQPITIIVNTEIHHYPIESSYWTGLYPFACKLIRLFNLLEKTQYQVIIQLTLSPSYYKIFARAEFQQKMDNYLHEHKEYVIEQEYWSKYNKDLNKFINKMVENRKIEILGTSTGILSFVTTQAGTELQLKESAAVLQDCLQINPNGFWFPYGMYAPGLDLFLREFGFSHTYVSSETIEYADPPPRNEGRNGVITPQGIKVYPIQVDLSDQFSSSDLPIQNWINFASDFIGDLVILADLTTVLSRIYELESLGSSLLGINSARTELETVHLCHSFLPNSSLQSLFSEDSADLWTTAFKIEQEIERNSSEFSILAEEWIELTGQLSSQLSLHSTNAKQVSGITKKLKNLTKTEKRKLLLLSWEYPPNLVGGLARHVGGLAENLVTLGIEVHIITANPDGRMCLEEVNGVFVHRVQPLNAKDTDFLRWIGGLNIAMEKKARELSGIHSFALVHAHDWLVGACAVSLKEILHIPLISTIHATESGRNGGIYTEMQSFIHRKEMQLVQQSDQIIVCSSFMKNEVMDLFQYDESKITIIPNGIENISDVQLSPTQVPYVKKGGRLIFSIGRMVQEKGFETIISAADDLCARFEDIYFIVAGRGPMLEEYRRKVKERKLENRFCFPGFISDQHRAELFSLCEIAVFPSLYEPFGIVTLEAMTAGKPVIVSNTGGLKGIVQHGSTGLLMEPDDHNSMIEHVSFLLSNKEEAEMIGLKARRTANSLFSWTRIAEMTKRIYEETLIESKLIEKNK